MKSLLEKLNIKAVNFGGCTGANNWIKDPEGSEIISYNPTTSEPIAKVIQVGEQAYETILSKATKSFKTWQMIPAPKRGEVIRDLGQALREVKEPLGELVTLEMGKIKAEGMGEV